jgi:hypothetical protein
MSDERPATVLDPARWIDEHGDYLYRRALARVRHPDVAEDPGRSRNTSRNVTDSNGRLIGDASMAIRNAAFCLILLLIASASATASHDLPPLPSLDELLKEYRDLGLPLPPKDAPLVWHEQTAAGVAIINGKRQVIPATYCLAFEIKNEPGRKGTWLLIDIRYWEQRPHLRPRPRQVSTDPDLIAELLPEGEYALVLATQCHARGWAKLAERLRSRIGDKTARSYKDQFASWAWEYWKRQLSLPGVDRAPIARRLQRLIEQHEEFATEENRTLLHALNLTLVPSTARPGSIEAMIDDLVDFQIDVGIEQDERFQRILRRGFDAVPALLDHVEDGRLTRIYLPANPLAPPAPCEFWPVKEIVLKLLASLAGDTGSKDWYVIKEDVRLDKSAVKRWWEQAKKVGEEAYILSHVVKFDRDKNYTINDNLVTVIGAKYPKHLSELYRTVLDKYPAASTSSLATALLRADLPIKEKLEVCLYASGHKTFPHRVRALEVLKGLDKERFNSLLLAAINALPTDVRGNYGDWSEKPLVMLVLECDDPRVWRALERAAERAAVGFRIELIDSISWPYETRNEQKRIQWWAYFLNDATLCDTTDSFKFESHRARPYVKITVRDFAALVLADHLGVEMDDLPAGEQRTPQQWADLRARVQQELKRRQIDLDGRSNSKMPRP